jgi:DNA repair exonuclease SbcCD nuclease subunit
MMTYARMNSADLVLIAGDGFDGDFVGRETLALLVREFENFGRPVFISPGNHDYVTADGVWKKNVFPKNVHVFTSPEVESVDVPELGVTVYGYAFCEMNVTDSPIRGKRVQDGERINLLVGHADIVDEGGHSNDCPITRSELRTFGADYAALAHIHNNPPVDPDGHWCYSGCLEPRSFRETGPKGACMVEIDKKNGICDITVKRVRFAKRRYERGELALSGEATMEEVRRHISDYLREKRYGEEVLLSLTLTGEIDPALIIDTESLEEAFPSIFMLKITDETRPSISAAQLESDMSITGEVYRQLRDKLDSTDTREREVAKRALRYALAALSGDRSF